MSLLDRYIARQYLTNVVILLLLLFCFVITIDVSFNLDRFSERAAELCDQPGQVNTPLRRGLVTVFLVADLWWPRLVQLYSFVIGMVLVGAMGFTLAQLVRHRELIPVLTSGQSLFRVARPFLIVALALTLVQAMSQEVVIPRIAALLTRDHGDAGSRDLGASSVPLTRDGKGRLFYARSFDADKGTVEGLYVIERDEAGIGTRRIAARSAVWRDGGWDLRGATAQTPADAAPRDEGAPERIETDLNPTTLTMRRFAGFSQRLSSWDLSRMLAADTDIDEQSRENLERVRWGRPSTMISNLLALVIAMSFFLTREPRNMVVQSIKCAPVAIVALMGGVLGVSAAVPEVPPQLSVFIPVMILLPVAIATSASIRT